MVQRISVLVAALISTGLFCWGLTKYLKVSSKGLFTKNGINNLNGSRNTDQHVELDQHVQLPLKTFYCVSSNGNPKQSQDGGESSHVRHLFEEHANRGDSFEEINNMLAERMMNKVAKNMFQDVVSDLIGFSSPTQNPFMPSPIVKMSVTKMESDSGNGVYTTMESHKDRNDGVYTEVTIMERSPKLSILERSTTIESEPIVIQNGPIMQGSLIVGDAPSIEKHSSSQESSSVFGAETPSPDSVVKKNHLKTNESPLMSRCFATKEELETFRASRDNNHEGDNNTDNEILHERLGVRVQIGSSNDTFSLYVDQQTQAMWIADTTCDTCGRMKRFTAPTHNAIASIEMPGIGAISGYQVTNPIKIMSGRSKNSTHSSLETGMADFLVGEPIMESERRMMREIEKVGTDRDIIVQISSAVFASAFRVPSSFPQTFDGYLGLGKITVPGGEDSLLMKILQGKSTFGDSVSSGYFWVEYTNSTQTGKISESGETASTSTSPKARKAFAPITVPTLHISSTAPPESRYEEKGVNWVEVINVVNTEKWFILVNSLKIDGSDVPHSVFVNLDFSSDMMMPSQDYALFIEKVIATFQYPSMSPLEVPCDKKKLLPEVEINIYNEIYKLNGDEYTTPDAKDPTVCHINIQAHPTAAYWTLGSAFHRKYAVTYDFLGVLAGLPRLSGPANWWRTNWVSIVVPSGFVLLWALFLGSIKVWGGGAAAPAGGATAL